MSVKKYLLAHDLGTSGNKAVLFTIDGRLVDSKVHPYDTTYSNTNWAEQNPSSWWEAVCQSTQDLVQDIDPSEIAAVAFSGQMMGCLCVDRNGVPLRDHILYSDQRSVAEETEILEKIDPVEFYNITGHRASASYSAAKLMWVKKNQPDIYKQTHKMLHAKDYINFRLTGNMATEYSDASGTNLLDLTARSWSETLVSITGIDGEKLPELKSSTDVVGTITKEAAAATGLVSGIPVVAGAGDGVCAGVGVGSVKPGATYNYLGSSSWIATTSETPIFDSRMRTFNWAHAVPGYVHPCGTMQTAGSSYAWLRNEIGLSEQREAEASGESPYELMNRQIEQSPVGARGLLFLPYLLGERTPRWDPDAKGAFVGLTLSHTRADLLRAVLEGVTLNLGIIVDIFKERVPIEEVIVIGGGAKGRIWRQIMADVYDAEILKPKVLEEATSMGAAVIAGVGAGVFKDFSAAERFVDIESRQSPDPANQRVYRKLAPLFDESYHALKSIFATLSQFHHSEE